MEGEAVLVDKYKIYSELKATVVSEMLTGDVCSDSVKSASTKRTMTVSRQTSNLDSETLPCN